MKTTFKMGKVSFTATKKGGEFVTKKLVAKDNKRLDTPVPLESKEEGDVNISFELDGLETTFEASPEEMIEIYRVLGPVIKDVFKDAMKIAVLLKD